MDELAGKPRSSVDIHAAALSVWCAHCCANAYRECVPGAIHLARFYRAEDARLISRAELSKVLDALGGFRLSSCLIRSEP
jgi:hypothetical protein